MTSTQVIERKKWIIKKKILTIYSPNTNGENSDILEWQNLHRNTERGDLHKSHTNNKAPYAVHHTPSLAYH